MLTTGACSKLWSLINSARRLCIWAMFDNWCTLVQISQFEEVWMKALHVIPVDICFHNHTVIFILLSLITSIN